MILYIKNPKDSTLKLSEIINTIKLQDIQSSIQKFVVFL